MVKRWMWYNLSSIIIIFGNLCLVPLTTYKLDSIDFAYFGLITSITVVGANLSAFGFNFVLSKNVNNPDKDAESLTISTLFWFGLVVTVLFSILLLLSWKFIAFFYNDISNIPRHYLYTAIFTNIFNFPGILFFEYLRIKGKSFQWSLITTIQFLISSLTTLFFIYILEYKAFALFAGPLLASVISLFITLFYIKKMLKFSYSLKDVKYLINLGKISLVSSSVENLYNFFERLTIIRFLGESKLGVFIHSLYYRQMGLSVAGTFSNSIWPETINEANDPKLLFKKTTLVWFIVYMIFGIIGITSALFGKEILHILTNGKFTEAWVIVPFWIIFLLVQHSGRSHNGLIFAKGHGVKYVQFSLIRIVICIVLVFVLIKKFGIFGVVFSSILSMVFFRVVIYIYCQKRYKTKFEDNSIIFWIASIIVVFVFNSTLELKMLTRIMLMISVLTLFYLIFNKLFQNIKKVSYSYLVKS